MLHLSSDYYRNYVQLKESQNVKPHLVVRLIKCLLRVAFDRTNAPKYVSSGRAYFSEWLGICGTSVGHLNAAHSPRILASSVHLFHATDRKHLQYIKYQSLLFEQLFLPLPVERRKNGVVNEFQWYLVFRQGLLKSVLITCKCNLCILGTAWYPILCKQNTYTYPVS